jgi:hypothetical protein
LLDLYLGMLGPPPTAVNTKEAVMNRTQLTTFALPALLAVALIVSVAGCSDNALLPVTRDLALEPQGTAKDAVSMDDSVPPAGLVTVTVGGAPLTFWPYTGASFDGSPVDPVNLIFVGKATPVQIRAALLALDGDRGALGLPPISPFNDVWSDATGDVQTAYADGDWLGSVIQLQMGTYDPMRVHLRLFATGLKTATGDAITLGAAHFELKIPGTADHQVLSWKRAQELVAFDLMRTGLLDPAMPMVPTPPIHPGTFRDIPPFIYNELPAPLQMFIEGPPAPVAGSVGIKTSYVALVFNLAEAAPVLPGVSRVSITQTYDQLVPKPFCNESGYEWFYLTGPVTFDKSVTIGSGGRFEYTSEYSGMLMATPVDISVTPPQPIGAPFEVRVSGTQNGFFDGSKARVMANDRRVAPQDGGAEIFLTRLHVATQGRNFFSGQVHCLVD